MLKVIVKIFFLILLFTASSYSAIINSIDITGNKRLSRESILMFGKIDINKNYSNEDLNIILKDLYQTDFFKQIDINIENKVLKINVLENPIIENIEVNGVKNKAFKKAIVDALSLKDRKPYIETLQKRDINLIKNIIKTNGYYFGEIKTSLTKNDTQNSIQLTYDIELGERAKIKNIIFIGDKKIKDKKLKNIIASEESKFWKFISNKVYLDNERINLDKRLLENYYKNNGYYSVKIENSFVEFQNERSFKLVFKINAGEKFTFNKVGLNLPQDFDSKHFEKVSKYISKLEDKDYSLNRINKVLDEIDKIALLRKYEFINADLEENILDNNKLDISININESEKFYVEKINVLGNQFTLEEVIRNSFIVDEGDPYNELLFNKSINNIKSKRIFKTVKPNIKPGSKANLKIIDISVEEKPTGEISLGAGVGSQGGTLAFGVKENNFLGRGINLDTSLAISESTIKGQFVYSKPNFNYTDNTLYTALTRTTTDHMSDYGYKSSNTGFSVGTRFEQYENLFFRPTIATNLERLETTDSASAGLKKQEGNYSDVNFNYSLDYDLRNQRYQTSDGYRNFFAQELPLYSENPELVNTFQSSIYQKLPSYEMVGRLSFFTQAVNSLGDDDVRISKRLYVPPNKLRGFEQGKVGPKDKKDYIGGNYVSTVNLSSTLPQLLPSIENLDISLFFDAANIWGVDYDDNLDDSNKIRSSAGLAMDVLTPIGPLSFSLSQPITKKSTDVTQSFRFNLGTTF
ncbi:outer membrane protein assembly factor BamA [Pelagibacterales bacterium SAG-MED20]|nr:outer membrane protein assembly factor BamA [Pelagibacterales bacterium SAG-MED20]